MKRNSAQVLQTNVVGGGSGRRNGGGRLHTNCQCVVCMFPNHKSSSNALFPKFDVHNSWAAQKCTREIVCEEEVREEGKKFFFNTNQGICLVLNL